MDSWSDQIRHINVRVKDYNDAQSWAIIEVRLELKLGALIKANDVQIGLYCDGDEIAVGHCDSSGFWRTQIEDLKRSANDSIFEVQARVSLKRAYSERKHFYQRRADGSVKHLKGKDLLPTSPTPDPSLQLALPEMVKVRSGGGWVGRSAYAHRVHLSRPLLVSAVPVTQALYEVVTGTNPSHFKGPRRPVERVNFWDALAFCNSLSESEGLQPPYLITNDRGLPAVEWRRSANGYRLLTETEWEYIARAGKDYQFSGGEQVDQYAWYHGNARGQTHPVGQKKSNSWGFYDCSGNVWEWCFDEWDETAYDWRKGEVHTDPLIAKDPTANKRVRRGGCWIVFHPNCAVSYRFWGTATQRSDDTGFRIARTL